MKFPDAPHSLKMACGENQRFMKVSQAPSRMENDIENLDSGRRISRRLNEYEEKSDEAKELGMHQQEI